MQLQEHDSVRNALRFPYKRSRILEEGDWTYIQLLPCGHEFKNLAYAVFLDLGSYEIWELLKALEKLERHEQVGLGSIHGHLVTCKICRETFLKLIEGFTSALIAVEQKSYPVEIMYNRVSWGIWCKTTYGIGVRAANILYSKGLSPLDLANVSPDDLDKYPGITREVAEQIVTCAKIWLNHVTTPQ